ncbi:MAG: DUF2288 family protein [Pseudobdellovibrionaceae bacterium]|nr:DUF2288 family protein [Pseudobdellovibrionaceae bacterium]
MSQNPELELRPKLAAEVDIAPWSALVRHFAFGRVYIVRSPWDILDAALALHRDDKAAVQEAMTQKRLEQPHDEEVQAWVKTNANFDVLVISPFVLIQVQNDRQT